MRKLKKKKVIVAMSGGVDSSVAVALLKQQGYDLIGVFMKFWAGPQICADKKTDLRKYENRCCSTEAENRARKVAEILNIPFYVFNFEKEFKKRIVDYFLKEYKEGRTPNPCVVCNKEIKFGLLIDKALKLGADYVATGHYTRLGREIRNPKPETQNYRHKLFRGRDKNKDQSYFLWQLSQKQLRRILFPVGDYTKEKVKTLAKKFNLPVLDIPESQEICFIPANLNDFLARHLKTKPGLILTTEGKKIGQHQGLPFYTIGQRKGIELPGGPFYVAGKDLKKNVLIVTPFFNDKNLYSKKLIAKNVNWISGKEPKLPLKIKAQIRYGHKAVPAIITKTLKSALHFCSTKMKVKTYTLKFSRPQRAITPGQSVVFYSKNELLGGGIIC